MTKISISDLYKLFERSSGITTDTRKIKENNIYFALKGPNFNGNKFAEIALNNGASFAICDEVDMNFSHERVIQVDNVLTTLQHLARHHRNQLSATIIGITGSNGKTTTKELIKTVLEKEYNIGYTLGNLNNHIGVPLTLLGFSPNIQVGIVEMGASKKGDINELCEICDPDIGIITSIGKAHLEEFRTIETIIDTKTELYRFIDNKQGILFYHNTDKILIEQIKKLKRTTCYSYGKIANISGTIHQSLPNIKYAITTSKENATGTSKLYGDYNYTNILCAIAIGNHFDIPLTKITEHIATYIPTNNRSEIIKKKETTIYLDAYNANPSSMIAAIDTFSNTQYKTKQLVLGDMLELGQASNDEHIAIITFVIQTNIPCVFIGKEFHSVKIENPKLKFFPNKKECINTNMKISAEAILIKGSRGIGLETLVDQKMFID